MCVVALSGVLAEGAGVRGEPWGGLPERVADDEEGYISGRGGGEDRVGGGLNHFSVCDDDRAAVELLLYRETPSALFGTHRWGDKTCQLLLLDHEDACVGLKVDPFGFLDDLETGDGDVFLVRETETNEIQHPGKPFVICGGVI